MLNPSLHLTQTLDSIINVNPSMRRYRNRKLLIIVIACLFLCASHHSESRNPEADSFALCPVPHPSLRSQRRPHNTWLKDPAFRFRSASTRTTRHVSHVYFISSARFRSRRLSYHTSICGMDIAITKEAFEALLNMLTRQMGRHCVQPCHQLSNHPNHEVTTRDPELHRY
ncbi:hypothetical protein SISNIDRAFT_311585 [Sistotremastrum niveocremeum HHB9708]|uniref:Uncharacterized protein n=1 Tax=Sistotremastrum niveocremeum HHB9708 TaxID=1314777 RepID=A0A164XX34_9AGAM|nr:hypothetical protein SISNIDRAFT_311585 [Sistotremastrum niveocremeum HHB9708]